MNPETDAKIETAYQLVQHEARTVIHDQPGVVLLGGRDRLDLLNRMSTNDLADLPAGCWKRTVLTNALARIVDVVIVFSRTSDTLLLTSSSKAPQVLAWLSGYIFFQDEVQVSLPEQAFSHWAVYGPKSAGYLPEVLPFEPSESLGTFCEDGGNIVWRVEQPRPGGYELLLCGETTARAEEAWQDAHHPAIQQVYEILRIESGLPRIGYEITEDTIPLEVGLWDDVSFNKGCYIGQEILARMESRGQIAHRLVLMQLSGPLPHGTELLANGMYAGRLTSVVHSPHSGWIGLALVKPTALEGETLDTDRNGTKLRILDPLQSARIQHTATP